MVPTYIFLGSLVGAIGWGVIKSVWPAGTRTGDRGASANVAAGYYIRRRVAITSGVRERLHGDDRRGSREQRRESFSHTCSSTAKRTLTIIIALLMLMLGGIAYW